ncbi:GNAT family N-acetyltransferase [Brevibacterium antiquum]|uniref:GNAT family N-acetyltransferase n=1 Tax=Brevibacterium antiquum TaxID=234835 RepID=UPI0018E063EB|nr:GNAT family N-acetyltransferase [Brevibacterium antiquum]
MSETVQDSTGARVRVEHDEQNSAFVVRDDSGEVAGRAHYLVGPRSEAERIMYHTEVGEEFSGRGLAKILVSHALKESSDSMKTVVPVCPLFAERLKEHGNDFLAIGGRFRWATEADVEYVKQNV